MYSWDGAHGIFGTIDEMACKLVMNGETYFPGFYDVPINGAPVRIGNGMLSLAQGDFCIHNEYVPCIAARFVYIDDDGIEQVIAEVFAPFRNPDNGEERGWIVVARDAYNELVEAVMG